MNKGNELTFPPLHNAGTVPPGKLVGTWMQRSPPVPRQIRISEHIIGRQLPTAEIHSMLMSLAFS